MTRPLTARAGRRRRGGALALAIAVAVFGTTGLLAVGGGVAAWEETLFRWGNTGGPPWPVVSFAPWYTRYSHFTQRLV